jgi:arginyl-tRNA synthetase
VSWPCPSLHSVITGDLDRVLATTPGSAGTWRPAPSGIGSPGGYATSVAFGLARRTGGDPVLAAAGLADRVRGLDWVAAAGVTGAGYLTVTVTAAALARLAVRISQAGPACARSTALAGTTAAAPPRAVLADAVTWEQARRQVTAMVTARLAEAAGARIGQADSSPERGAPPDRDRAGGAAVKTGMRATERAAPSDGDRAQGAVADSQVRAAIGFAGADAIVYALARRGHGGPARIDARLAAAHHTGNPAYAVAYAHAHAASTLRQAADLGFERGGAARFAPGLLAHPAEQSLLYELSWLPERVAGAARRGRPDAFARYLEKLAGAYLSCQERCPAVWPGMPSPGTAPPEKLWLVFAAQTALAAGLGLLGVSAPARL